MRTRRKEICKRVGREGADAREGKAAEGRRNEGSDGESEGGGDGIRESARIREHLLCIEERRFSR
jgi:hypothetical protein